MNVGEPGSNFGWPFYEGGSGGQDGGESFVNVAYRDLPIGQDFFSRDVDVVAPQISMNHVTNSSVCSLFTTYYVILSCTCLTVNAIVLGVVISNDYYGEQYRGNLLYNNLGGGTVTNIPIDSDGRFGDAGTFVTGAKRVVKILEGPDGLLYYVTRDYENVGRWEVRPTVK